MDQRETRADAKRIWAELKPRVTRPVVVVMMGVSGSGKTTVAALLAAVMHWEFQEGDDLHPAANIEKMRNGRPLTDADRWPWLARVAAGIDQWRAEGVSGVVTCSALKPEYRKILIGDRKDVALVYLRGSHDIILNRMAARHEHYMPVKLLDSQFATLEEPAPDEHAITIDVSGTPQQTVVATVEALERRERAA